LKVRQWRWVSAAAHEQAFAFNTWFITLTYKPGFRAECFRSASAMENRKQSSTKRLVRASGHHVANYIKRLRKSDLSLRYVCVPELHRDGFPHWHGLVHDLTGNLTWERLTDEWSAGFSVVKIVRDANAIRYVAKYLSKDRIGRVRASRNYGAPRESVEAQHRSLIDAASPQPTFSGIKNGISSSLAERQPSNTCSEQSWPCENLSLPYSQAV
jgi:hypothetical protein